MFDNTDAARTVLRDRFDPDLAERLVATLIPALLIEPLPGPVAVGATRLGGVPDLPAGVSWPRAPAPADIEAIASRGNKDAGAQMRRHMTLGLPYAFIAQIDLAEAAKLGEVASRLPAAGRLLFFYDNAVGPWETSTRIARVIWDRAEASEIAPLPFPEDLAAAIQRERDEAAEAAATHGVEIKPEDGTIYDAPAQAATLKPILRLPHIRSIEIEAVPELYDFATGKCRDAAAWTLRDAYGAVLEEHGDDWPDDSQQQLLGSPVPVQDDPRYDAVVVAELDKDHLSSEEWKALWPKIEALSRGWTLLLQITLEPWALEGTVYFCIRTADLARHEFGDVFAVYQQT